MRGSEGKGSFYPKNILSCRNSDMSVSITFVQCCILCRYGDYYVWNKVTTCIHNILSGRRWIEHYGEVTIRNTKSSVCICKLTFVKVRSTLEQKSQDPAECFLRKKCKKIFPVSYLRAFQTRNHNWLTALLEEYKLLNLWRSKISCQKNKFIFKESCFYIASQDTK